jgi:aquaporin Z
MNKYLIECIATFFLVLTVGIAAVLGAAGAMAPLAIGVVLVVLLYMGGHISGAHYNPAVTLAVFIRGRCKAGDVAPYMAAQLIGGAIAALVVRHVFAGQFNVGDAPAEITLWIPGATGAIIASELLFTFLLCFVVLNVATSKNTAGNDYFGIAIGFTVLAGAFTVGSISLGGFNPAVSFGLAIMGKLGWTDIWMHLFPQLLGSILAGFAFKGLNPDDK